MPIIRSSRVLYRWSLPVVFGAIKMEKVICRLGRICVFGIKCRADGHNGALNMLSKQ